MFTLLLALAAPAGPPLAVTNGPHDLTRVVVVAKVPADAKFNAVVLPGGKTHPAQMVPTADGNSELVFVMPALAAGQTLTATPAAIPDGGGAPKFAFKDVPGEGVDLLFDGRRVLRYVNLPRDGSTKDTHELTFKPFHHVFDPAKGETLLTNGPGLAADKALLYPHHRGLFFAFNRISYGDQKDVDTWHGKKGEYTLHEKMLASDAGPVAARQRAKLAWHGRDGKPFAAEEREVTAYRVDGGTLLDWRTTLSTTLPKVRLDGDPQHAGFHFRAAMEVSKNGKANTYYVRPDGKGKPGETRNWEPKTKEGPTDLPWDACSFVVSGQRYTVLRMSHPTNPKESRGSERDYGRFGDYFEYDLSPEKPLTLRYRVWVQAGEMTVEQCEDFYRGFTAGPAVK